MTFDQVATYTKKSQLTSGYKLVKTLPYHFVHLPWRITQRTKNKTVKQTTLAERQKTLAGVILQQETQNRDEADTTNQSAEQFLPSPPPPQDPQNLSAQWCPKKRSQFRITFLIKLWYKTTDCGEWFFSVSLSPLPGSYRKPPLARTLLRFHCQYQTRTPLSSLGKSPPSFIKNNNPGKYLQTICVEKKWQWQPTLYHCLENVP